LTGGDGRDIFAFEPLRGASLELDSIHDFRSRFDSIGVSDLLVTMSAEEGFTQMILTDAIDNSVGGEVHIFGTAVQESDILI